ncbi:Uncharacterised protein [Serratia ficaria]|uniref:hypothetical protein n=1 Tax=Serratia ficaria TaxID=61651 RepID=UPI002179ABFD|nr:hypothetical protein [Serratia ficaria]CAI1057092.1 Uncharacterised protein [Serratia ficaria]CAI1804385.1 Uncharacterised protein [Serratia ficaria]CAI2519760.1 Uncharacterised protein [Serratia ficaria]CAI2791823.1 Uncharacterised protein [Serratia ficaria]
MSWLSHVKAALAAVAVTSLIYFAISSWGLRKELQLTQQQLSTSQLENSKQAGLITTLQAQDTQNRALVAAQQQQEQQLRQQHDILQRKYREAIKNDPCAAQPMPGAVVELLQQNIATGARTGDKPAP